MRIATYNVNGINGRLANLLGWLEEARPDIGAVPYGQTGENAMRFPHLAPQQHGMNSKPGKG